jgi:hypothetical protein
MELSLNLTIIKPVNNPINTQTNRDIPIAGKRGTFILTIRYPINIPEKA